MWYICAPAASASPCIMSAIVVSLSTSRSAATARPNVVGLGAAGRFAADLAVQQLDHLQHPQLATDPS